MDLVGDAHMVLGEIQCEILRSQEMGAPCRKTDRTGFVRLSPLHTKGVHLIPRVLPREK